MKLFLIGLFKLYAFSYFLLFIYLGVQFFYMVEDKLQEDAKENGKAKCETVEKDK